MIRQLLNVSLASLLALGVAASAEAGNPFGINIGGVKIGSGGGKPGVQIGGGGVKISLPGHVKPPVIKPPVHPPVKPPVFPPIKPPIIKPCPPIVKPPHPPIVCPKPPIVIHPPHPPVVCPKPPIVCPPPVVTPPPVVIAPTNPWYFGMACERVQTTFGIGLRVSVVTPGGPAEAYGLKVGDVLLVAGSVNLSQASSNDHGVMLVQSAVTPQGTVAFTLVDASTGMLANLTMSPTPQGAPAPTAGTVALNPAQPTSTM